MHFSPTPTLSLLQDVNLHFLTMQLNKENHQIQTLKGMHDSSGILCKLNGIKPSLLLIPKIKQIKLNK